MKKTLLLAAAALFAAQTVFAVDMYVVGANVNGADAWSSQANKMTETSSGVYEWSGTELGSGFKFNNGSWDDENYNIGADGDQYVTLGTAKAYATNGADFLFDGFKVTDPKVVLNMNAKTVTVSGTRTEVAPPDPNDVTFYIIGTDVNGKNWALMESDCAFTDKGNGIYEWTGENLGTGFKINDGTWGDTWNIGSNGSDISMNVPYFYGVGGSTGNIAFNGFTNLINPVVELNVNEGTVTLKGGTAEGLAQWYIMGINNNWDFISEYELLPVEGEDGIYENLITVVEQAGAFKISDTGWSHELGTNYPDEVFISPDNMEIQLDDVYGEGGNVNYELLEGTYKVRLDLNEYILTFSTDTGVETVVLGGESNAVYYNLHGQKVANPDKGIYVKVANGKAVKVVR